MTIKTTSLGTVSNTPVYTSAGESAVTFVSICNYGGVAVLVDINIVPNGDPVDSGNLMVTDLEILAGDTYILYQGGEKILLGNNDKISVKSNIASSVTVITSSAQV